MPQTTRRLAAIMFTDIVGYTAMMQQDEAGSVARISRFREIMAQQVEKHQGELLEIRGDGSLSIFGSAVDAVACAKAIQQSLRENIPLRIGIHLGDVVQNEDHIFGDAVNIASRIESMGVAGAILVSDNVRNQIKNKPEFQLKSLGRFSFKNVEGDMTVFALSNPGFVVPEPDKMKGKGKKVEAGKLTTQQLVRLGSIGFLAMAVGMVLFWAIASRGPSSASLLPKDIRESKVAVSVFENFTGDAQLDALGYLASEWISSGLRELKVRTVSPDMVRQHKDKVGILPNNPEGLPSFGEITGASYVITGSYFLDEDTIVLNTRLSSTETGEDVQPFPQVKGHLSQKEQLVDEARQYLLGYWIQQQDLIVPEITPPKYEAYRLFVDPAEQGSFEWIDKALAIDPNFIFARSLQTYAAVVADDDSVFNRNKTWINGRWDQCTEYEKNWFREAFALWEGNYQAAFQAMDANYQVHPEDMLTLHESGFVALVGLNRPDIAVERYEEIFNHSDIYRNQVIHHSFRNYLIALIRLGAYQKASDFYLQLPDPMRKKAGDAVYQAIAALIYQNRIEAAQHLMRQRGNLKEDQIRAAFAYAYLYPDANVNPFAEGLRQQLETFEYYAVDWGSRAMAYYVLQDWKSAEEILLALRKVDWDGGAANAWHPNYQQIQLETLLGVVYAHQAKREAALRQIEKVSQLGKQYHNDHHSHFRRGETPYYLARIYAVLGEREKAVEWLEKAIDEGKIYDQWEVTLELDFVTLKGYAPFVELVKPD